MNGHTDTSYEWAETVRMAIKALEQEPILDKIRAEIEQIVDEEQKHDEKWASGLRYAVKIIEKYNIVQNGTPLEQEPKTGHWVEDNINEWSRKVFCSECGCTSPFEHVSNGNVYSASGYGVTNKTKYCPNCGAKMVERQAEEDKE